MSTVTSDNQTGNRHSFGSMDVLTATAMGIFAAGVVFGACHGSLRGGSAAMVGALTGGTYATVGGTVLIPFVLLASGFAGSKRTIKITHCLGGAASLFVTSLAMLNQAESILFAVSAAALGAVGVWAFVNQCISKSGISFDEPDTSLLYRMTR